MNSQCNTVCWQEAMLSIEDDGTALTVEQFNQAFHLQTKTARRGDHHLTFGEGMKIAVKALTQETGFIVFFSRLHGDRVVALLERGSKGQAQFCCLRLPMDWTPDPDPQDSKAELRNLLQGEAWLA